MVLDVEMTEEDGAALDFSRGLRYGEWRLTSAWCTMRRLFWAMLTYSICQNSYMQRLLAH
jgi:hypothetical protein